MKQNYKTKTSDKYDQDIISLLILTLDYLVENKLNTSEIYHLSQKLQEQPEITLKLLSVDSVVMRLSDKVSQSIDVERQFPNRGDSTSVNQLVDQVIFAATRLKTCLPDLD